MRVARTERWGCEWRHGGRVAAALIVAAAPLGCAAPSAGNPFLGRWATADRDSITFRPDTVVEHGRDGSSRAFGKSTCAGNFRFGYTRVSREKLTRLLPYQPRLRRRLGRLLSGPRYAAARLVCDRGDETYVLLNARRIVAIYRDGSIGAIERLERR